MKTFQLDHVQMRIWYNEDELWAFAAETVAEARFQVQYRQQAVGHIAVELLIDRGERYLYGALCTRYTPGPSADQLMLHIPLSASEGSILEDSLAAHIDLVHVGLPREYVAGVQRGIQEGSNILGAGTLDIIGAAHGQMYSNQEVFRRLGLLSIHLLNDPLQLSSQEDMGVLLQQLFQRKP